MKKKVQEFIIVFLIGFVVLGILSGMMFYLGENDVSDDVLIYGLLGIVVVLIIIVIIGVSSSQNKKTFKPKFIVIDENNLDMELYDITAFETKLDRRMKEEYPVGREIEYNNNTYTVDNVEKVEDNRPLKNYKMVFHLRKRM